MDEKALFLELLQKLHVYTNHPMFEWERLPDYLKHQKDPLLQDFIMHCDPYVGMEECLDEYRSWRFDLNGRIYYLLCRDSGYQLGILDDDEIVTFSPSDEEAQAKLQELVELVEAKAADKAEAREEAGGKEALTAKETDEIAREAYF